jgi:hypothetical protein
MSKPINKSSGGYIVLITVLILSIVMATIAVFLLLTGSNTSITAQAADGGVDAKAAATGCAELALAAIQASPTLTTPNSGSSNLATSDSCTYSISGSTPSYTITATGTYVEGTNTFIHNLTVKTSQTTPSIIISSWQDTP